jgi:hypothetical protein
VFTLLLKNREKLVCIFSYYNNKEKQQIVITRFVVTERGLHYDCPEAPTTVNAAPVQKTVVKVSHL